MVKHYPHRVYIEKTFARILETTTWERANIKGRFDWDFVNPSPARDPQPLMFHFELETDAVFFKLMHGNNI
jgi:hypothetical protein